MDWKAAAQEVKYHDENENLSRWRLALLIVCHVQPGEGQGKRNLSTHVERSKVSAVVFAKEADRSDKLIMRYYRAWEALARDEQVPLPRDMMPDAEDTFELADDLPDFGKFVPKETKAKKPEPESVVFEDPDDEEETEEEEEVPDIDDDKEWESDYDEKPHDDLLFHLARVSVELKEAVKKSRKISLTEGEIGTYQEALDKHQEMINILRQRLAVLTAENITRSK